MRRRGLVAGAAIAHHRDNVAQQQYQQGAYDQMAADQQASAAPQEYQAQPAPPPPSPPPAAPPADPMDAKIEELKKLGQLHDSGILTDEEFAAQKQKILDS